MNMLLLRKYLFFKIILHKLLVFFFLLSKHTFSNIKTKNSFLLSDIVTFLDTKKDSERV